MEHWVYYQSSLGYMHFIVFQIYNIDSSESTRVETCKPS